MFINLRKIMSRSENYICIIENKMLTCMLFMFIIKLGIICTIKFMALFIYSLQFHLGLYIDENLLIGNKQKIWINM